MESFDAKGLGRDNKHWTGGTPVCLGYERDGNAVQSITATQVLVQVLFLGYPEPGAVLGIIQHHTKETFLYVVLPLGSPSLPLRSPLVAVTSPSTHLDPLCSSFKRLYPLLTNLHHFLFFSSNFLLSSFSFSLSTYFSPLQGASFLHSTTTASSPL